MAEKLRKRVERRAETVNASSRRLSPSPGAHLLLLLLLLNGQRQRLVLLRLQGRFLRRGPGRRGAGRSPVRSVGSLKRRRRRTKSGVNPCMETGARRGASLLHPAKPQPPAAFSGPPGMPHKALASPPRRGGRQAGRQAAERAVVTYCWCWAHARSNPSPDAPAAPYFIHEGEWRVISSRAGRRTGDARCTLHT